MGVEGKLHKGSELTSQDLHGLQPGFFGFCGGFSFFFFFFPGGFGEFEGPGFRVEGV